MASTFDLYRQLAQDRPAKALRYRASIQDTLARENIHPIERERLTDALAGIAAGFADSPICTRCGRAIESDESVAAGLGSHCRQVAS
jgi:hypothetical protein